MDNTIFFFTEPRMLTILFLIAVVAVACGTFEVFKRRILMNIKRVAMISILIFLTNIVFLHVELQGDPPHTRTNISSYLDAFFIHVEKSYLGKKRISDLYPRQRAKLLGYALGLQAKNVQDVQRRRELFDRLEKDLENYFGLFTVSDDFTRSAINTKYMWRLAQEAMLGFHEEEIIRDYGIDPWSIPNMFDSQDPVYQDQPDPKSLIGKWKSGATGDVVRFVKEGNAIRGYVVAVGRSRLLQVGELWGVFTKTGDNVYAGKVKFKDSNNNVTWLEGVKIVVEGNSAYAEAPFLRGRVTYTRE
jgi:hypothetical protein